MLTELITEDKEEVEKAEEEKAKKADTKTDQTATVIHLSYSEFMTNAQVNNDVDKVNNGNGRGKRLLAGNVQVNNDVDRVNNGG